MNGLLVSLTVFTTGAAIMILEVLGTRVIGPFYGVSLFVWSSLISVALAALAVGYFLGGLAADRNAGAFPPHLIVALAALATAGIPWLRTPVLSATNALGDCLGSLASASLLFTAPLCLLAMIGPYFVKLRSRELGRVGTAAGTVFAVSTIGSVFGTLLVGFVLLPLLGAREILYALSLALGGLSLVLATALRRESPRGASVAVGVALILTIALALFSRGQDRMEKGSGRFAEVHEAETFYGRVRVVDDRVRSIRWLLSDSSAIGAVHARSGVTVVPYLYLLETLPLLHPEGKTALLIGLGAGHLPRALARYGVRTDVIEIDPAVVEAARCHFGFEPPGRLIIGDARYVVRALAERYDFVIHDSFTGGTMPFHLLSVEMLRTLRGLLRKDGILALNYFGFVEGGRATAAASVAKTLGAVFDHRRTFASVPGVEPIDLVFFASDRPIPLERLDRASVASEGARSAIGRMKAGEKTFPDGAGFVVTDDYNPLDILQVRKAEAYRKALIGHLGVEVLAR